MCVSILYTMMTSSSGNIFRVTCPLCGEEFPTQRPVTRSFGALFDLRPNKRLNKQSWGWWFETPSRPLWRHNNDIGVLRSQLSEYTQDWDKTPTNKTRKGLRRGALMFTLWFVWTTYRRNSRVAGDLRRRDARVTLLQPITELTHSLCFRLLSAVMGTKLPGPGSKVVDLNVKFIAPCKFGLLWNRVPSGHYWYQHMHT